MGLTDIIGQDNAIGVLLGIIERHRFATSYLFCGESGIGKKTAAVNFAKALNCRKSDVRTHNPETEIKSIRNLQSAVCNDLDSCDKCESCKKIDAGAHPDFLLVSPEDRQIRIEEIRSIEEALSFRPFEGRIKVIIVDEADSMNSAASNAFLKTLEEPPEDSLVILVSSKPDYLPDTIRSRCSRVNFAPLSPSSCKEVLSGKIPEEKLDLVARLAMGRPGYALSSDLIEERDGFLGHFESMMRADKDSWASRDDMIRWFELMQIYLRDITIFKITGEAPKLINSDLKDVISKVSNSVDLNVIIYCYSEINKLKESMMFNLNKSITWNYISSLLRKELTAKRA
jgi:DNA polymerase-3 subunit delta'